MQKLQNLENEYFFKNWNDSKRIFGPEIDENEIHGRAQYRLDPLRMAEASFSCAARHWNSLTLVISEAVVRRH